MRAQPTRSARFEVAAIVFRGGIEALSDVEIVALRKTGWRAILGEGAPPELGLSARTLTLIDQRHPDAYENVPESDGPALMFAGFLAMASEIAQDTTDA